MNKNKKYRVWLSQGYAVDIEAQKVELYSINDRSIKIKFLGENDYLLAEFYCDLINGWAEVTCLLDPSF